MLNIQCCLACGRDTDDKEGLCDMCKQARIVEKPDICRECKKEVHECICDEITDTPMYWAKKVLLSQQGYD